MSISETWKYMFADNIRGALDQTESKLTPHVRVKTGLTGEGYRPETIVESAAAEEINEKGKTKDARELGATPRWMVPRSFKVGPFRDSELDRIRNGIDFTGTYTTQSVAAINRRKDILIADAFFDNAMTGKYGGGSAAAFDTTNMRVAAAGTGLTTAKLIAAKKVLIKQHVDLDMETPRIAITEEEWENLMNDVLATSAEFVGRSVLPKGVVEEHVGFKIILFSSAFWTYEVGSGITRCPFWVPSAVELGDWGFKADPTIRVAHELEDEPYEVYSRYHMNAARLDELKVGDILCDQN